MTKEQYEKYYPKIYNYVYYRILNKEAAEDITADTFYNAAAFANSYDKSRGAYSTWIFTIARNCILKYYRNRRDIVSIDEFADIPAQDTPTDETLISKEDCKQLHELLQLLSERERSVLALRYWGEFSYKEIAAQTNLSESNVGVILNRALKHLKELWN